MNRRRFLMFPAIFAAPAVAAVAAALPKAAAAKAAPKYPKAYTWVYPHGGNRIVEYVDANGRLVMTEGAQVERVRRTITDAEFREKMSQLVKIERPLTDSEKVGWIYP